MRLLPEHLRSRGVLYWYSGQIEAGLADLARAQHLAPRDPRPAFWAELIEIRRGRRGRLPSVASQLDMKPPYDKLVGLLLGTATAQDVYRAYETVAAAGNSALSRRFAYCGARLLVGLYYGASGKTQDAVRLLQAIDVPSKCPLQNGPVRAELK